MVIETIACIVLSGQIIDSNIAGAFPPGRSLALSEGQLCPNHALPSCKALCIHHPQLRFFGVADTATGALWWVGVHQHRCRPHRPGKGRYACEFRLRRP